MVERGQGTRRALVVTTLSGDPRDERAERELISEYLSEHRLRMGGELALEDAPAAVEELTRTGCELAVLPRLTRTVPSGLILSLLGAGMEVHCAAERLVLDPGLPEDVALRLLARAVTDGAGQRRFRAARA